MEIRLSSYSIRVPEGLALVAAGSWVNCSTASSLLASLAALSLFVIELPGRRYQRLLGLLGGLIASSCFFFNMHAWLATLYLCLSWSLISILSQQSGKFVAAARQAITEFLPFFLGWFAVPLTIAFAALAAGATKGLVVDIQIAMISFSVLRLMQASVFLVAVRSYFISSSLHLPRARLLAHIFMATTLLIVGLRLWQVCWLGRLPSQLYWSEGPYLIDMLKLRVGAPLYGPVEDLNSYIYSPLSNLLGYALLRPLGAELSIYANRILIALYQVASIGIIGSAMTGALAPARETNRSQKAWLFVIATVSVLSSFLVPVVHPDHGLLLCGALVFALCFDRNWSKWTYLLVLFSVTPVALGFKFTGAGLGAALGIAALLERNRLRLGVLFLSLLAALGTLWLFESYLGEFSFYTIRLLSAQPIRWHLLYSLPFSAPMVVVTLALAAVAVVYRRVAHEDKRLLARLSILSICCLIFSLPAFLKYGGRNNNLDLALVCGSSLLAFCIVRIQQLVPRGTPLLLSSVGLMVAVYLIPPSIPFTFGTGMSEVQRQQQSLVKLVREERLQGRKLLVLVDVLGSIVAGNVDVPRDRASTAFELYAAKHPAGNLLFQRIAQGQYDTVVGAIDSNDIYDPISVSFSTKLAESLDTCCVLDRSATSSLNQVPGAALSVYRRRSPGTLPEL